jgi:hypothetical protein
MMSNRGETIADALRRLGGKGTAQEIAKAAKNGGLSTREAAKVLSTSGIATKSKQKSTDGKTYWEISEG